MDVVVDEVALLEDALRDALERRRQGAIGAHQFDGFAPVVGQKFDSAVASYGVQLKAWIDWQVDAYLREVMPSILDGELGAARHDCIVAVEVAERVEGETRAVAEAQAKLLAVVEGISGELARLKGAVATCQAGAQQQLNSMVAASNQSSMAGEEALIQVQALRESVEELRRSRSVLEQQEKSVSDRVDALTREFSTELKEFAEEVQLGKQKALDVQNNVRELIAEDRRQTVETIEKDLAPLLTLVDQESRIEARLEGFRGELLSKIEEQLQSSKAALSPSRMDSRLEALQVDIEERVAQHVEGRMKALRQESTQATQGQIEEAWARTAEEFASLQERLIKELRSEMTAAFAREDAAIAALDEQLWITDQRLGQRIDELAHLHLRERVALAERQTAAPLGKRATSSTASAIEQLSAEPPQVRRVGAGSADVHFPPARGEERYMEPTAMSTELGRLSAGSSSVAGAMARRALAGEALAALGAERSDGHSHGVAEVERGVPRYPWGAARGGSSAWAAESNVSKEDAAEHVSQGGSSEGRRSPSASRLLAAASGGRRGADPLRGAGLPSRAYGDPLFLESEPLHGRDSGG